MPPPDSRPSDPAAPDPAALEAIRDQPPAVVDQTIAVNSEDERLWLENQRLQLENLRLQSELDDLAQDRKERRKYAARVFRMVLVWLAVMNVIVLLQGFHVRGFDLPVAAVLTLVGSTTVSVLGIFLIIATYLFPKR